MDASLESVVVALPRTPSAPVLAIAQTHVDTFGIENGG
jgi:hypothetical protein